MLSRRQQLQMTSRSGQNGTCSSVARMSSVVLRQGMFMGRGTRAETGFLLVFEALFVQQRRVDRVGRFASGVLADKGEQQLYTD